MNGGTAANSASPQVAFLRRALKLDRPQCPGISFLVDE